MSICAVAIFEDGILCKLFLHFYIFKYQIESKVLFLWRQAFRLIPKNEISFCFRYYCDRNSLQRTIWGYRRLERIQGNSSIENHDCIFHLIIRLLDSKLKSLIQTLHSKNYNETMDGGKQERMRKQIFLKKDANIKKHNSGKSNYKMGHNQFSDRVYAIDLF